MRTALLVLASSLLLACSFDLSDDSCGDEDDTTTASVRLEVPEKPHQPRVGEARSVYLQYLVDPGLRCQGDLAGGE